MNFEKFRRISFFITFFILLAITINYGSWGGAIVIAFVLLLGILIILFPDATISETDDEDYYDDNKIKTHPPGEKCLVYYGDQLKFSTDILNSALSKHSPFFTALDDDDQKKFISRLIKFIDRKTFKIYDKSGFREMPILISAAAIQVSFGLENYLLPNFSSIN